MSEQPPRGEASYEDLKKLPPHVVGELVGGELHVSPRPSSRHALAATVLGAELVAPFGRGKQGPGGWLLLHEPELHLGQDVLVPDIAGWRRGALKKSFALPEASVGHHTVTEPLRWGLP